MTALLLYWVSWLGLCYRPASHDSVMRTAPPRCGPVRVRYSLGVPWTGTSPKPCNLSLVAAFSLRSYLPGNPKVLSFRNSGLPFRRDLG